MSFLRLRKAVITKVRNIGHDEIYANPAHVHNDDNDIKRQKSQNTQFVEVLKETYTGSDLKQWYRATRRSFIKMLMLVVVSADMILYAMTKFVFSRRCDS